jgi:hypothetical protein
LLSIYLGFTIIKKRNMKNFIFTFLLSALVLCAGLNVSFGSHEIKKFDKVKIEKSYEMKTVDLVVQEISPADLNIFKLQGIKRSTSISFERNDLNSFILPLKRPNKIIKTNKNYSAKLKISKKYLCRSTC